MPLRNFNLFSLPNFCRPPTIYRMLILADLSKFDLTQLHHCCSAGEPLDPEDIKMWRKNNDEENEKSFMKGFYYTGDKAYRDGDSYFWFVGCDDDVIKSSGYRIGPFEVESALLEHPAVIGVPDNIRGMIVKAFILLHKGFEPSDNLIKKLQDHVKRTTAPYKYPRAVEFVNDLPKTVGGKIKRKELRHMEAEKIDCECCFGVY